MTPNVKLLKIQPKHIFAKNTNLLRPGNLIGEPFIELSEVDSTNNYAMQQVQAGMAEHGATWFAGYQTLGKGQRGKPWSAEPWQNIMMSVVVNPFFLRVENQFLLNVAVALACYDFFNAQAGTNTCIKWPNDLYWKDKKAGGILIENVLKGSKWRFSIIGIGININQTFFPPDLPNPVSLKLITGKSFNVIDLAKQLCKTLNSRWQQLASGNYDLLFNEYSSHLYKKGEVVTFKRENSLFDAVVVGVNKKGELLVNTGEETALAFGSVEWILAHSK